MQLREYLSQQKISLPAFAEAIGVTVQAVHRYVSGERVPRHDVMARIAAETKGKVLPNDMHETVAAQTAAKVDA